MYLECSEERAELAAALVRTGAVLEELVNLHPEVQATADSLIDWIYRNKTNFGG